MNVKKSVGIWIRVSTEIQEEGDSPEHHLKRGQDYASFQGWDVRAVYHPKAVSGKSVMHHPETKKMLKDIKDGTITGLIFSRLARLARNTKELLEFSEYFRQYNADLISLNEAIDTSSPAGRLFFTVLAALAQFEREEIAERVAASVPIRAKLGKPLGGQASYGYEWKGKQLVVNETEAKVRKLMYELFLKYQRKKTTAEQLNKLGYRTRNGSEFSDTTVGRLLRDPTAKGMRIANHTKSTGEKKKWVYKPSKDWVVLECTPIVTEDVWEKCNQILNEQEKKRRKPGRQSLYLLAGFVTCTCGRKMYVFHQAPVYTCKTCKNKIAVADIDKIYHEQLKSFLFTDSEVSVYLKQTDSMMQEKESLLHAAKTESEKIRKRMEELIEMRLNKELLPESFQNHYKPLERQLGQLDTQIPSLEAEVDFLKVHHLSSETILSEAKNLYNHWPEMPVEERRPIVETITELIEIGKEEVTINLVHLPTPLLSRNAGTNQHKFTDSLKR